MHLGQWISLLALLLSLYILWQIRQVLFLVFTAVILATALNRVVQRLKQSGVKQSVAVALTISLSLALLVLLVLIVGPLLFEQFQQLVALAPEGLEQLHLWLDRLQTMIPQQLLENIDNIRGLTQQLQPFAMWLLGHFYTWFYNSFAVLLNLLLIIVLTIMLLGS